MGPLHWLACQVFKRTPRLVLSGDKVEQLRDTLVHELMSISADHGPNFTTHVQVPTPLSSDDDGARCSRSVTPIMSTGLVTPGGNLQQQEAVAAVLRRPRVVATAASPSLIASLARHRELLHLQDPSVAWAPVGPSHGSSSTGLHAMDNVSDRMSALSSAETSRALAAGYLQRLQSHSQSEAHVAAVRDTVASAIPALLADPRHALLSTFAAFVRARVQVHHDVVVPRILSVAVVWSPRAAAAAAVQARNVLPLTLSVLQLEFFAAISRYCTDNNIPTLWSSPQAFARDWEDAVAKAAPVADVVHLENVLQQSHIAGDCRASLESFLQQAPRLQSVR